MNACCDYGPHICPSHPALQRVRNRKQNSKRDNGSCGQVLVCNEECGTCNGNRQQGSDGADGCPTCFTFVKAFDTQLPARIQGQECRSDIPDENAQIERKVRYANAGGNQFIEQSNACVVEEKFCAKGIQIGIQEFLDAWKVNLCIFDTRMITMHQ